MAYKGKYICTITRPLVKSQARDKRLLVLRIRDRIGRILPIDYGKQVWEHNGVLYVENDEQKANRLARRRATRRK